MSEHNLSPDAMLDAIDTLMSEVDADPRAAEWARKVATRVVTAYLSALPAQPDTVNSVEELDNLPDNSVVLDNSDAVLRKWTEDTWYATSDSFDYLSSSIYLPATVLYKPEAMA